MRHLHLRILLLTMLLCVSVTSLNPRGIAASTPIQPVYSGLNFPVAFTFLSDGRTLFNEKNTGNIRMVASNGTLLQQPFATLGPLPPGVDGTEQGLLGIALDPHFTVNNYVYAYWTFYNSTNYKHSIISRFTAAANLGINRLDIFDFTDPNPTQPPSGPTNHNGGYIKFGPDGKLYVEIGDFCSWDCLGKPLAQNLTTYAGKILRMNADGSVPSDNPFGSLVYAYGYRNGVGMDFSPVGKLIATMAGPDCCDRLFFANAGANLGWPNCGTLSHTTCSSPYTPSIFQWGATVTPTGIAYSTNSSVLYFGEFETGNLMRLILTSTGTVAQLDIVATLGSGILAVERGLDGLIYFSTPDTIYRIPPPVVQVTVTSAPTGSGFVMVDGTSYSTPHTFNWVSNSTHTIAANSPTVCGNGCQYIWFSWSDNGGQSHDVTPLSSTTYTAIFQKQYQLTISVIPQGGGTTSPATGSYWINSGQQVFVSVSSAQGFSFNGWTLDGSSAGTPNPIAVTMSSPRTLTASFLVASSITVGVSLSSIMLGNSVTLTGAITPKQPAGTTILLSYSLNGVIWNVFIGTQTDSAGMYSVSWAPPYPGTYQIRASWSGNAQYSSAVSSSVSLTVTGTVTPSPNLILLAPATSIQGQIVHLTITVFNPTASTFSTLVTAEITGPGSYVSYETIQVRIASQSETTAYFDWTVPNRSGAYTVTVGLLPPEPDAFDVTTIQVS